MSLRERIHPIRKKKGTLRTKLAPFIEDGWKPTDETKALLASEEYEEELLKIVKSLADQNVNILESLGSMHDLETTMSAIKVLARNNLDIIDKMNAVLTESLNKRESSWNELEVTLERDKNKLTKTMRIVRKS